MQRDLTEAVAITQELLDITGAAILSGDFVSFCDCFSLPTVFDTFEGRVRLDTVADLEARFKKVRAHYASLNMTDHVRHIVSAEWFDSRTIHATHQGRVLSGNMLMQAPYTVFSILKNTGTRWQITVSQYAIPDSDQHNAALTGADSIKGELND